MIYDNENREILEKEILSSLINDSELFFTKKHTLKENHFSNLENKLMFSAVLKSIENFNTVNLSSIRESIKDVSTDGLSTNDVISLMSEYKPFKGKLFDKHCELLFEYNVCDTLLNLSDEINSTDKSNVEDFSSMLDIWKTQLNELNLDNDETMTLSESTKSTIQSIIDRMNNKELVLGVTSGTPNINDFTCGWLHPDLILMAGRPGMGKSAYAIHNSLQNGFKNEPSAFFSYEMPNQQILERMAASITKVNSKKMLKGQLSNEEFNKVENALEKISTLPIHLIDKPLPLSKLLNKIRYLVLKHGVKVVYIDYVQLIPNDLDKSNNDEKLIGGISGRLKLLCMELKIPIVLLSQLSRAVESRSGVKKPTLSDLRGSGSLEQDADIVNFFYRPSYYNTKMKGYLNDGDNLCLMIMAKGRRIGTYEFELFYQLKYNYFKDWDNNHENIF